MRGAEAASSRISFVVEHPSTENSESTCGPLILLNPRRRPMTRSKFENNRDCAEIACGSVAQNAKIKETNYARGSNLRPCSPLPCVCKIEK